MRETQIKDKIYTHQAIFLITIYRMMIALTYAPLIKSEYANQDTWLIVLLSIPYTILFCLPLLYLNNKFRGMNLLEYIEEIMGKFIGRILGVVYGVIFLFYSAFFTSTFIEILDSVLYPSTPVWVNMSILIVTILYIVSKGLINVVRLTELVFPGILFVFVLLLVLGIENYDFDIFFPILKDSTFKQLNLGAMFISSVYTDILILTMIAPNLSEKKDLNKIFIHSLIYSTIVTLLSVVVIQATLGITYSKYVNFPFYNFARLIRIGDSMGFDLLYVVSWIIGSVLRLCGYFYTCTIAFGKIFNIRNQKTFIPIVIVLTAVVLYVSNRRTIITKVGIPQTIMMAVTITAIIAIPLILLITYFFRRKKLKKSNSNKQ